MERADKSSTKEHFYLAFVMYNLISIYYGNDYGKYLFEF